VRGLPLPPAGVVGFRQYFTIDGLLASVNHYIAVPDSELADLADLRAVANDILLFLVQFSTAITHRGCMTERVTVRRWGAAPASFDLYPADNIGAWTGGQLSTGALAVRWLTGQGGKGHNGHSFYPGFPDGFTDDHATVNDTGITNAHSAAVDFLAQVNAEPGVSGGTCVHGVVHTSAGGAPLPAATFTPTLGHVISETIATIDRRRTIRR
jgi:hypothetical protein